MSARAPEKAIVMKSTGKALVPTDVASEDAIAKIKGKEVLVWTERARNPKHHAKYMALTAKIFENQSTFDTVDKLRTYLKLRVGHYDSYIVDGRTVVAPRSTSYASMDQTAFEEFYERVLDVIVAEIVPGLRRSDLRRELLGFLEPRNAPPQGDERAHD